MEIGPKNDFRRSVARYFRDVDDTYIFDPATGLYKPRARGGAAGKQAGTDRRTRFFTDPRTDWYPIIITSAISLLTVGLLAATVYFARFQWIEMKRAADESTTAATAASN